MGWEYTPRVFSFLQYLLYLIVKGTDPTSFPLRESSTLRGWPPVSLAYGQASELESRAVGSPLTNAFWVQHKRLRSPHQLTF